MSVEGLDSAQQLLVVPAVDEDLGVVLHAVGEDSEGPCLKLLLLLGVPLLGGHLVLVAHDDAFMPTNLLRMRLFYENVFDSILLIGVCCTTDSYCVYR